MISIDCHHPDIEQFIEIKSNLDKVTKANISIRVTNDFLEAVKDNKDFKLSFTREETGEVIEKIVKAQEIFDKFCYMNWDYAEPAFLFWDRIKEWNLLSECDNFEYAGTNPCFTGDMKLLTDEGYKTFDELNGKDNISIISYNGDISPNNKVWCSGVKEIVEIKFTNNKSIKCTPNHIFMLNNGTECEAKDLKGKRCMPHNTSNNIDYNERYIKYGFIQGDGQTTRLTSKYHSGIEVNIGIDDKDIYSLFSNEVFTQKSDRAIYLDGYKDDMIKLGFSSETLPNRILPNTFNGWSYINKLSFLRGLFSANGCVVKHHRVQFKGTCYELILDLQSILNDLGINSIITTNKAKKVTFNNGEYLCKQSYDLAINQYESIVKFNELIGFIHTYKQDKLIELIKEKSPYIISVHSIGKQKVYDFTENINHWGVVEDYIVHNCAEEPLPAGGSCLLGSINLSEFVKKPFTNESYFDFEEFKATVKIAVRSLNDVLDEGLPLHPLQEQRDSVRDWKQIGLGIMGLADMLIKLGFTYGDKKSLDLCKNIAYQMIDTSIRTSARLSKDFGTFPKYDEVSIAKSQFYQDNTSLKTKELVREYGLRNSQLLTIAPTGTLSTMLGISGGIEPIFANYYTRKTESLHGEDKYYKIFTPIVWNYLQKNNLSEDSELPKYFITSSELDYHNRINMQSIWQGCIDASISSTINLPNSATIEDIKNIYLYAWEKGLKGITVYRDGCKREGILTTNNEGDKDDCAKSDVTKKILPRGYIIDADNCAIGKKRKLTTGCGSLHCTAFFDPINGDLLETYLSKGSSGGCNNFMIGLSRMISLASRGGVNIESIIDQLNSSGTCPSYAVRSAIKHDTSKGSCCPIAIGNALKEMYNEIQEDLGLKDSNEEYQVKEHDKNNKTPNIPKCPECGESLIFEGGCVCCKACGWSKCD